MQDTFPSWLFSVKHGATTIWERWDGWTPEHGFQDPGMNSFNHYALGSCGQWLFDTVAGIALGDCPDFRPGDGKRRGAKMGLSPLVDTGFRHVLIHPRSGGGLTWARASYRSIRGLIISAWRIDADNTFTLDVTIPPGTTATVALPAGDPQSLVESGKPLKEAAGVRVLRHRGRQPRAGNPLGKLPIQD